MSVTAIWRSLSTLSEQELDAAVADVAMKLTTSLIPNSQNWPKPLRRIIVSRFPNGRIGNFDYSKLEVLLLPGSAGTRNLRVLHETRGLHRHRQRLLQDDHRERHAPVHADQEHAPRDSVQRGRSPARDAALVQDGDQAREDVEKHLVRCHEIRLQYLDMSPASADSFRSASMKLLTTKQVRILTGRVRHLPTLFPAPHFAVMAIRSPGSICSTRLSNAPVQGLASEVTGSAEVDVEEALCDAHRVSLSNYHAGSLRIRARAPRGTSSRSR